MPDSRSENPTRPSWNDVDNRLDSWKEIASYLERTVVTVQRWEKKEGLPVHRHLHDKQATVYASRSEIDIWLENRGRILEKRQTRLVPILLRKQKLLQVWQAESHCCYLWV